LRAIRELVEQVLDGLSRELALLYSHMGRPSIPQERLLKATLMQADVAKSFMSHLLNLSDVKGLLSSEHFLVDGTLIDACVSRAMRSSRTATG
jgi:hypothetical protein